MRRRSWSSELLIVACAAALPACKGRDAPPDAAAPAPASAHAAASTPPSSSPSTPDAAAADAGHLTQIGISGARAADAGPDFAAGECPSFDPDRWTAYAPFPPERECWLFTPESKDKLPAVAWEPCGREGFGARCRRLKLAPGERLITESEELRRVDAQGRGPGRVLVTLGCERLDSRLFVVADLDGPVTGALAVDPRWQCGLDPRLRASGWGIDIRLREPDMEASEFASLAAARGQWVPTKKDGPLSDEPRPDLKALGAWRKLPKTEAVATAMGMAGIKSPRLWVGTDGTDVVWTVAPPPVAEGQTCSVFTGRWVENPQDVAATHLVDLPCTEAVGWTVRCGFAAAPTGEGQTLLVRLADGTTYRFPKQGAPLDEGWAAATSPLDLSCKEVFLAVGGNSPNVFRVPLDALPTGTAPPEPPRRLGGSGGAAHDGGLDGDFDAGVIDGGRPPAR